MKTNTTNPATIRERLAAYRKEHFAVTATAPEEEGETVTLSITSNGNQWQTIGLLPEEIQRVIDALKGFAIANDIRELQLLSNTTDDYYTQMVHARGREEIALQANEDANREIGRLTKLVQQIPLAVNAFCTCGGGGPGETHTCPACEVYHALAPFLPYYKVSDTGSLRCADCGEPIGEDIGPPYGWQLEDGRTVCQSCCADDLKRFAGRATGAPNDNLKPISAGQ